jgi:hypothetical protein
MWKLKMHFCVVVHTNNVGNVEVDNFALLPVLHRPGARNDELGAHGAVEEAQQPVRLAE